MQTNLRSTALTTTLLLGLAACSGSSGGAPTAGNYTLATDRGEQVTALPNGVTNLLGSTESQREGLRLDTTPVVAPSHGTLFLFEDGTFSYTHDDSAGGTDTFSYRVVRVADPGSSSVGQVSVTITDPDPVPFAVTDDEYDQAIGNLHFHVGRPVSQDVGVRISGSVLDNDGGTAATVTQADLTTASGAAVEMNADGSFSVLFLPGFSGADSFSYTAQDGTTSDTGTVTITVDTPIWFVDDTGAATPGDGHAANPFRSLDELDAAQMAGAGRPGPNETIYLLDGSHQGELTLLDGQTLHGSGERFVRGSFALEAGEPAEIFNLGGNCLICADDNTIVGIDIVNTQGVGLTAVDSANLSIRGMTIHGQGQAMQLLRASVDLEFDLVQSLSSTGRGMNVENCSGTIAIAGDVTVNNSAGQGFRVATWPAGSSLTIGGALSVVAPALDEAVILETVDGSLSCGDVTVSARSKGGVRIDDSDGTIVLGDVDAENPNGVLGTPFSIQGGTASITISSLDAGDVVDDDAPITDPNDPAYDVRLVEENGVALAVRDFDGTLQITGRGLQGTGGTLDTENGHSAVSVLRGSPDLGLTGMTVGPTGEHGFLLDDNDGLAVFENVTIQDFDSTTGNGVRIVGGTGHVALTMIQCRIDGDSTDAAVSGGNGIEAVPDDDSARTWDVVLGDPDEALFACHIEDVHQATDLTNDATNGTCRFEAYHATVRNLDTTGLFARIDAPGATNRIRIFDCTIDAVTAANEPDGIDVTTDQGTNLVWIRDNSITSCADAIRFTTAGGTLSGRVATNDVVAFHDNGMLVECDSATVDLDLLGNSLVQATTPLSADSSGIRITEAGNARIYQAGNSVGGTFTGATASSPIYLDLAAAGTLDLTSFDNTLGATQGQSLVEGSFDDAGLTVRMLFTQHNGGVFEIVHDSGSVGFEKLGTLGEDNSGMTLDVSGTAASLTALADGTVQRPTIVLP